MPGAGKAAPLVNTATASEQYYRDVLQKVLKDLGWRNQTEGPPPPGTDVVWSEDPVRKPRLLALPHGCRTNRFFAMVRVCRKVCLAVLLDALTRLHPASFRGLAPTTWWVGKAGSASVGWQGQLAAHKRHCEAAAAAGTAHDGGGGSGGGGGQGAAYIVKPDNGCQGAGIKLVTSHDELLALLASAEAPERAVVQSYLPNPLLVDGLKFDLRLYVIITCASPLQAFLSRRGVARFASHPWRPVDASNQGDMMMHLSNSSVNQVATGVSNKWELPRLWDALAARGCDVDALWRSIEHLVALTLAAMQPCVAHQYATAFAVGGFSSRNKGGKPTAPAAAPAAAAAPTAAGTPAEGTSTAALAAEAGREPPPALVLSGEEKENGRAQGHAAAQAQAPAPAQARRCFQVLGFDVMLDDTYRPWLLEVNHSPSMALAGNEPEEVLAKCSVIRAALRLGLADGHPKALCDECEVSDLQPPAWPLCAEVEQVRGLFEASATSRSSQQWTMNLAAFEKLLRPCVSLMTAAAAAAANGGGAAGEGAAGEAVAGEAVAGEAVADGGGVDLRALFAEACASRQDVGSGWDAPAPGQMTLWGFTEAMLRLAERMAPIMNRGGGARVEAAEPGLGGQGLAAAVAALVAAARAPPGAA